MGDDFPSLLRPSDAAKLLGVSSKTVRRMLDEGLIPASRVRGRWYITKDSLESVFVPPRSKK